MELSDIILMLDRKYGYNPVICPNEGVAVKVAGGTVQSEHGGMGVHASGSYIVCGRCGAKEQIERV